LPLIPVLLGVVLLGFAVGAILSMTSAQREGARLAQALPSPQADITPLPLPSVRRVAPRPKFTPYPAVVPTIAHTSEPQVIEPSFAPASEPTVAATPTAAPTPIVTLPPVVIIPAVSTPTPAPTVRPASKPTPTAAAIVSLESTPTIEVDSEFAQEAAQAVRAYLTALQQGDEDTASAALAPGLSLSEEAIMDHAARITRIRATGTSTDASVQARIVAAQDTYTATFSVERGPKGPVIRAHDFAKAK
jgi:hypothetical protein